MYQYRWNKGQECTMERICIDGINGVSEVEDWAWNMGYDWISDGIEYGIGVEMESNLYGIGLMLESLCTD